MCHPPRACIKLINPPLVAACSCHLRHAQSTGTTTLISQPPHDHSLYNATMFHYTWGCIVKNGKGEEVWKFDKRFYTEYNDALKVRCCRE